MASIQLSKIRKDFGDVHVIRDIDIEIRDAEFVVFVGPSGCGKSTLLRMVAGLDQPTSGNISIGGRVVNSLPPKERDVAMVFQTYALYPHMTVDQNMGFGLMIGKVPPQVIREKVTEAARILGLDKLLDRYPRQLWAGRWRAIRRCFCSMSRCPTSTPSCGCRCALKSARCTSVSARHRSTSPTTRSRR